MLEPCHHAAPCALPRLTRLPNPARGSFVLINEDMANITDPRRTERNLNHAGANGIFRTREDWIALLTELNLEVRDDGWSYPNAVDKLQHYFIARPRR